MDTKIEQKKGLQSRYLLASCVVILLIITGIYSIFKTRNSSYTVEKDDLILSRVIQAAFNDYITINGVVKPITTVYLDAYESGRVVEKYVEEGSMVRKGDRMLKLENRQLYEQILASENNLAIKQNNLRETKINFESRRILNQKELLEAAYRLRRAKRAFAQNTSLYQDELIAKEAFLNAKEERELATKQFEVLQIKAKQDALLSTTAIKELDNDLMRMKTTLAMIYERIDHLEVKATIDGQLGMLDAEVGQRISKGQRIGQLHVLTDFKIQSAIDEHYIDRVTNAVTASLEREGSTYLLKAKKIYPEVREGQFQIDLTFRDKKPENIRTGQSYFIKLELGAPSNTILIDRGSFFNSSGGKWVYVVDASGNVASRRSIKIGRQNPKYFEVIEGLEPGEQVITSGYENFENSETLILN